METQVSCCGSECTARKWLCAIAGIVSEMGVFALFTRGLALRIAMVGTLTGLQW